MDSPTNRVHPQYVFLHLRVPQEVYWSCNYVHLIFPLFILTSFHKFSAPTDHPSKWVFRYIFGVINVLAIQVKLAYNIVSKYIHARR